MKRLKHDTLRGILFVLTAGSLAHFFYDWTGKNHIVGLFTPVNESVWEHMKLLFFPMLLYSLFIFLRRKKEYPCLVPAFCLGILTGTFLIPILFYAYTFLLGRNVFVLDLGTFVLSAVLAFLLSHRLLSRGLWESSPHVLCRSKLSSLLSFGLVCLLFFCFLRFSYHPPALGLFEVPGS